MLIWWVSSSAIVDAMSATVEDPRSSCSMKGACSCGWCLTNCSLHRWQIFRNVSHAMSCTPGCVSCMNSKFLFTTVLRNFQWARRKRGYCPTTYMMLEAMTALLSFPRVISHSPSRSLMTWTRKRFSSSSRIAPEIDPIAQQSVDSPCRDHPGPPGAGCTWRPSFSIMTSSVCWWSKCVRYTSVSRTVLCSATTSTSLRCSLTTSPFSSSTTSTSSGFGIRSISIRRTWARIGE
mmetsp:Transcript_48320/g.114985  ORF Transcript_48320/g.114985 Transcript_48320/m.114985 type:complete len:234 (+) Transcript_48320:1624-2325(+)